MPLREHVATAFKDWNAFAVILAKIARGRDDCGRPLGGEVSRQMARDVLVESGLDWNHVLKTAEQFKDERKRR
ncbi:MAG TPA: hypothetical protein VIU44_07940 [Gaiellaceae bacterium]